MYFILLSSNILFEFSYHGYEFKKYERHTIKVCISYPRFYCVLYGTLFLGARGSNILCSSVAILLDMYITLPPAGTLPLLSCVLRESGTNRCIKGVL